MKQYIKKIALFLGYAIFASWSAYMTANSLHLKWMSEMPFFLAFAMIFIISVVAGWLLTLALKEIKNPVNPNKWKFILSLLGFVVFWGFSFATNVHYSYVTQYGYENLDKEVNNCVVYLTEKTSVANAEFENIKTMKKEGVKAKIGKLISDFRGSIRDTRDNRDGFGTECITILKAAEQIFASDTAYYHDNFDYTIFNDKYDIGDKGVRDYNRLGDLETKYITKIQNYLNQKYEVIDRYYNASRMNNAQLEDVLKNIAIPIKEKALPQLKDKKDFRSFYACYEKDVTRLLNAMPQEYFEKNIKYSNKDGAKEVVAYVNHYPASRMFDFGNVWSDWFNDKLPADQGLVGKMLLALILDIVAFILICLI